MTYGCFDRPPYKPSHTTHGINRATGKMVAVVVPFRNSPTCNYTHTTLGQADAGCVGCRHRVNKEAAWHE